MINKVSFDFDGTLTRIDVQRYARLLIKKGYEVHIVTSRHLEHDLFGKEHKDLFDVANKVGVNRDNIHFLNCSDKSIFFIDNPDFIFHLDDDWFVVDDINEHCKIISVCILTGSWSLRCDELIKDPKLVNVDSLTLTAAIRKRVNELVKTRGDKDIIPFLESVKQIIEVTIKNNKNDV